MMDERIPLSIKLITGFSISGFIVVGYLSAVKLLSGTCVAKELCMNVLGLPICVYGLLIFLMLISLSVLIIKGRVDLHRGMFAIAAASFVGVLFSGYFSAIQFSALARGGFSAHTSDVPTCLIGLMMFMIIFATVVLGIAHRNKE